MMKHYSGFKEWAIDQLKDAAIEGMKSIIEFIFLEV